MRLAAVLMLLAAAPSADLMSWYPLRDGARWVYDCEFRTGSTTRVDVDRWREIVTVTGHVETPEGLIILRSVRIVGRANPPGGFRGNEIPLLWRGNCLYPLYPELWDAARRQFRPQFGTMLAQGSPELCFPLDPGAHWQSGNDWAWRVDGRGPLTRGPQDVPRAAIRIVQETSAGPNYVWFEKGVGRVASWTWHNGTYTETFERLVR